MSDFEKMVEAAKQAMIHTMDLKSGESVLIVTDSMRKTVGEAFAKAAEAAGAVSELYFLPDEKRPLSEIPKDLPPLLEGRNVVINAFIGMAEETPFRIKWIKKVVEPRDKRLGHAPGITEDMMLHGPMNIDYAEMKDLVNRMLKAMEGAKSAHVTSPAGTDLTLNIEDRGFMTDVYITNEHWGNLPAGEIWCGPHEDGADGVFVCDGSIGDIGMVKKPLKITVEKGKIANLESKDSDLVAKVKELTDVDEWASVIGELGIGLNPGARITGNLLEDEKAFHTIHIAFGNNDEMPGGENPSETHRDFLTKNPTLVVTYKNGSQRTLIEDGEVQV